MTGVPELLYDAGLRAADGDATMLDFLLLAALTAAVAAGFAVLMRRRRRQGLRLIDGNRHRIEQAELFMVCGKTALERLAAVEVSDAETRSRLDAVMAALASALGTAEMKIPDDIMRTQPQLRAVRGGKPA